MPRNSAEGGSLDCSRRVSAGSETTFARGTEVRGSHAGALSAAADLRAGRGGSDPRLFAERNGNRR